jgi:hypothetical protein
MDSRLFIPLLLVGAVALACGSRSHSEAAATAAPAAPAARTAPRAEKRAAAEIRSAFAVSAAPSALHFALNVTNPGKKGIELSFPSGQEYDFSVRDSVGREVYRWGKGRMFTQSRQNTVLDGGETKRFEEHASTTLPAGSYVAIATLRSSNYPVQERVAFELR